MIGSPIGCGDRGHVAMVVTTATCPLDCSAEDSPRGLWRTLGKRVGLTPSRVQIPYPPPRWPAVMLGGRSCRSVTSAAVVSVPVSVPVSVEGRSPGDPDEVTTGSGARDADPAARTVADPPGDCRPAPSTVRLDRLAPIERRATTGQERAVCRKRRLRDLKPPRDAREPGEWTRSALTGSGEPRSRVRLRGRPRPAARNNRRRAPTRGRRRQRARGRQLLS